MHDPMGATQAVQQNLITLISAYGTGEMRAERAVLGVITDAIMNDDLQLMREIGKAVVRAMDMESVMRELSGIGQIRMALDRARA